MNQSVYQGFGIMAAVLTIIMGGCSTLGVSLYPSAATLTTEAREVLNASGVPKGIPRENAKSVLPPHALQPGDALLIEPVNLEHDLRLPADQVVLADGTVDLGPYGRLIVAGRSLEQAEALVEQQIAYQLRQQDAACEPSEDEDAQSIRGQSSLGQPKVPDNCDAIAVNVRLLEPVHQFYVLGEVNAPGSYPLTGSETVLDAIVNAGGLTTNANPCQILLARPTDPCECRVTLPVCYREIVQMGNTSTNYQLRPGDRVFVSTRSCMEELLFWRASRPCSRCAGCNRPCRHPEYVTTKPMPMVENTMIPPGSVGWMRLANDPLRLDDLVERDQMSNPSTTPVESNLSEFLNGSGNGSSNKRVDIGADVDGELDFSQLPDLFPQR